MLGIGSLAGMMTSDRELMTEMPHALFGRVTSFFSSRQTEQTAHSCGLVQGCPSSESSLLNCGQPRRANYPHGHYRLRPGKPSGKRQIFYWIYTMLTSAIFFMTWYELYIKTFNITCSCLLMLCLNSLPIKMVYLSFTATTTLICINWCYRPGLPNWWPVSWIWPEGDFYLAQTSSWKIIIV